MTRTLARRIEDAALSGPVARAFSAALRTLAAADGEMGDVKRELIERLVDRFWSPTDTAAPFEALWPHAELFLTTCITVAVADGEYSVEEARAISLLAHRLGYSVRGLSGLESRVFADLKSRAQEEAPTVIRNVPLRPTPRIERDPSWLQDSDSEIIIPFMPE